MIYFAANEMCAFQQSGVISSLLARTTAGYFNAADTRGAMRIIGDAILFQDDLPAITDLWCHFVYRHQTEGSSDDDEAFAIRDVGAGQTLYRGIGVNGPLFLEYWNGVGFTTQETVPNGGLFTLDLRTKIDNAAGEFAIYNGGARQALFEGDTDHGPGHHVDEIRLRSRNHGTTSDNRDTNWSEIIIADECTIGGRVPTIPVTSDVVNQWTSGGFANLAEVIKQDGILMSSGAADQLFVGGRAAMPALAPTERVAALAVSALAQNAVGGPQNLEVGLRSGGNDFFSGNLPNVGAGLQGNYHLWNTDPDTAAAWTEAGANAALPSMISRT